MAGDDLLKVTGQTAEEPDDDEELDEIAAAEEERVNQELKQPGSHRSKKTRNNSPQFPELDKNSKLTTDVRGKMLELQDVCRIHYLRHFKLDPRPPIIRQVWGEGIKKSDWEWGLSWTRIGNHHGNWKGRSIAYMKVLSRCSS